MIEIKNVKKSFGSEVLFENLSIKIARGEFIIICGESGSGKTTLLNMVGALEKVDSGVILVNRMDISKKRNQLDYFRNTVGFLFQNFVLLEDKTVRQNLNIVRKQSRSGITIEESLQKVGLENKIDTKVYALSGGEQQRVALARLMIKKCSLILADEPTGSLDGKNTERVMDILTQMNKDGKTVILVTHNNDLRERGDRVIEL